jgi:hypothetical protein
MKTLHLLVSLFRVLSARVVHATARQMVFAPSSLLGTPGASRRRAPAASQQRVVFTACTPSTDCRTRKPVPLLRRPPRHSRVAAVQTSHAGDARAPHSVPHC